MVNPALRRDKPGGGGKTFECGPVVVNPSLRRDKPSGGGRKWLWGSVKRR